MARKSKKNTGSPDNTEVVKETRRERKRRKRRNRKKHPVLFTIVLFLFCLFASGMLTGIFVGGTMLAHFDSVINGPMAIDLDTYKSSQSQTSFIYGYDSHNEPVELYRLHGEENRVWVDYEDIPERLQWAFICLEDKRFYEHPGVDFIRTIGVFINPAYEGQGASTITQQLIKNLTDQNENTYKRKFNEILKALNFEKNFSKKDILEAYLNTASLGAGCYGVKTAAETYFDKELSELTISECATIAGITKAPYSLNPYVDYEACMERRDDCLFYMHDQGKITDEEYEKALKEKIVVQEYSAGDDDEEDTEEVIMGWYEEYVIDEVIEDLQREYGYEYNEAWRQVYYGGLNIYSAVDLDVQEYLEYVYRNRVDFPDVGYDAYGNEAQSSMTIMDYQGRIVALVGGCDEKTSNRAFNRATDVMAKRQPGSSIKPLTVYGPAMDLGYIQDGNTTILDKAITDENGDAWPQNYEGDHGSNKNVSVYQAVGESLNTVPARMIKEMLGLENCYNYANNKFHLNLVEEDATYSGMACGGTFSGVTTLEMAAAYAVFGNGGRYFEPYSYYKVTDRNGTVILDNTKNKPEQAISEEAADKMLDVLINVCTASYGTGYGTKVSGFDTFSKTGTTSDDYDKWYCGGTPHYVTAIWFGFDYNADTSSARAKTIFSTVFDEIHLDLESKEFSDVKEEVEIYMESVKDE